MTGRLPSRWALVLLVAFEGCRTATGGGAGLTPRERAQVLLQRGDPQAVDLLEELHHANPRDLDLSRQLAEAHVKAGTAPALLARLQGQDDAVSQYLRGLVLFSRAADATGPAIAAFERAAQLEPSEPEFHYRLGIALLESERFEDALEELRAATSLAPARSGWHLALAKAQAHAGDPKGAVKSLGVVVAGGPTPAEVKTARALMEQLADPFANFPRAARPQLDQALQWLDVADVPQQAIGLLEEIEHDFPDLAVIHALLGLASARLDDAGRAVDELKRAIELAPDDGMNHLYLGELYLGRQKAKLAQEHFQEATLRNPVLETAWFRLGDLALERQDFATARRDFEIASHLAPEDANARGKLALVCQLEGDWPGAERELKVIIGQQPENLEFILRLGLLQTERYTRASAPAEKSTASLEARKWLEKVLESQPENALASRALERLGSP